MAVAALVGTNIGGRLTHVVNPTALRWTVVVFGAAVAIRVWIT